MSTTPPAVPAVTQPGFLVATKTVLVDALRSNFATSAPSPVFDNLYISIEYPQEKESYPGIWVNFEPVGNLTRGGIDQGYQASFDPNTGWVMPNSLWYATGYATFTLGALTSMERDSLFDIMVALIAFSRQDPYDSFRAAVESNPLLGIHLNADTISIRGSSERPTTEWGGPEIVYETTVAVELVIEFGSPAPLTPPGILESVDVVITVPDVPGTDTIGASVPPT
jgi:hypothetical protein